MNFQIINAPQGSPEWFMARLGVVTASNIEKVLAKKGSATRQTIMSELVAQIATRQAQEISAAPLEWGKKHEENARRAYCLMHDCEIEQIGFMRSLDDRKGCSPDGKVVGQTKGTEIKCPWNPGHFIEFITSNEVKKEWEKQCQFSMWVSGFDQWDLSMYDPRMTKKMLHTITYERDLKLFERFNNEIPDFIYDMDQMLLIAGYEFGEQWSKSESDEAA